MALFLKGDSLRKLGKPQEAIECFDEVLKIEPDSEAAKEGRREAMKLLRKGARKGKKKSRRSKP